MTAAFFCPEFKENRNTTAKKIWNDVSIDTIVVKIEISISWERYAIKAVKVWQ